jgi:hypothetical protein
LTRQSIHFEGLFAKMMDARVILDQVEDRHPRMTNSDQLARRMTVDSESPELGLGLRHGV